MKCRFFVFSLLLSFSAPPARAQSSATEGREFYVTFMANQGLPGYAPGIEWRTSVEQRTGLHSQREDDNSSAGKPGVWPVLADTGFYIEPHVH
jgi:hypothetical protein